MENATATDTDFSEKKQEETYVFKLNDKQQKMSEKLLRQVRKNMSFTNKNQNGDGIDIVQV